MQHLKAPSPQLQARILQEVDFQGRLVAAELHVRSGVKIVSVYSVAELFALLKRPCPQIVPAKLDHWIRRVIQDEELADGVKAAAGLEAIRDLVGQRLDQCRTAARKRRSGP